MPDLTQCPDCQRKLNLPDGQLGQTVRCPACGAEFMAERYVAARPAPAAPDPEPPPAPPRGREYPSRDHDPRDDDRDDDRPPRRRPYGRYNGYGSRGQAGRGSTVQTLGVLSLCFCWAPLLCWIMGIIALVMASQDLSAMDGGTMDPADRQATKTGQTFAIIGLVASGVLLFSCCGLGILGQAIR